MRPERSAILGIWCAAIAGAFVIGFAVPEERQLTFVTVFMLVLFLVAGGLQTFLGSSKGFIMRIALSTVGAFAILAFASLVMALLGGGGGLVLVDSAASATSLSFGAPITFAG